VRKIPVVRILDNSEIRAAQWALWNSVSAYWDLEEPPCEECPLGPVPSDKCLVLTIIGDEGELHELRVCDLADLILGAYEKGKEDANRELKVDEGGARIDGGA